mgnify:CR=1 FL=1
MCWFFVDNVLQQYCFVVFLQLLSKSPDFYKEHLSSNRLRIPLETGAWPIKVQAMQKIYKYIGKDKNISDHRLLKPA